MVRVTQEALTNVADARARRPGGRHPDPRRGRGDPRRPRRRHRLLARPGGPWVRAARHAPARGATRRGDWTWSPSRAAAPRSPSGSPPSNRVLRDQDPGRRRPSGGARRHLQPAGSRPGLRGGRRRGQRPRGGVPRPRARPGRRGDGPADARRGRGGGAPGDARGSGSAPRCWCSPPTTPTPTRWQAIEAGASGYLLEGLPHRDSGRPACAPLRRARRCSRPR